MSGSLSLTSFRGRNCPADELATVEPTLAIAVLIRFDPAEFCNAPLGNRGVFPVFPWAPWAPEFPKFPDAGVYRSLIPLANVADSGILAQSNPPSVIGGLPSLVTLVGLEPPSALPNGRPTRFRFLVEEYLQFGFSPSSPIGMP